MEIECTDCDGTGIVIGTTAGCCGNANPDESCCGCSIPEPIQEQCQRCEATGFLQMCPQCFGTHTRKDYEGYCSQSCFDGI